MLLPLLQLLLMSMLLHGLVLFYRHSLQIDTMGKKVLMVVFTGQLTMGEKTRGDDDLYGNFILRPRRYEWKGHGRGARFLLWSLSPPRREEGLELKRHETLPFYQKQKIDEQGQIL